MEQVLLFSTTEDEDELRALLKTLKITIVKEFVQKRVRAHKAGFLGPGKLDEVEKEVEDLEFDAIVVNGDLKPSQHHYLEMRFQKECIDRTGVILRIFAEHAHTPEAIAQVTLAKLRYEQPFLREWIHKAKKGDRPGFLAGGAYATDVYYEHARSHAKRIELSLKELSRQRELTRTKRHAKGYSLISLAGYTNAGKSALFNALCEASVVVDDLFFSTLSTTTRKVLKVPGNILMVDTVGFISNLPTNLIDAFNSTLEEIFYADMILLVFDSSEPIETIKQKLATSMSILLPRIEHQKVVVVGNKVDLVKDGKRDGMISQIKSKMEQHDFVFVSALTGEGIDELREMLASVQERSLLVEGDLPHTDSALALLSRLRTSCTVNESINDNGIHVILRCKTEDGQKIVGWMRKAGGRGVSSTAESPPNGGSQGEQVSSGNEGAPLT
jgi:GTP-binding protein HflX